MWGHSQASSSTSHVNTDRRSTIGAEAGGGTGDGEGVKEPGNVQDEHEATHTFIHGRHVPCGTSPAARITSENAAAY